MKNKFTLNDLRLLKRLNLVRDITEKYGREPKDIIPEHFKVIGTSSGIYGINGALFEGCESGNKYVILKRNSNLLMLV
jgi:hypothetical protein